MMHDPIEQMLDYHIRARHYPGALVWIESGGKAHRYVRGALRGHSVAEAPGEPMHEQARFRVASLTKMMVSTLALILVSERLLRLDAPLADVLPELRAWRRADGSAPSRAVTLRDALRHTAGLGYGHLIRDDALRERVVALGLDQGLPTMSRAAFLETVARYPLLEEPGTAFRYGFATDLVGLMAERVTGLSLGEALQRRLFQPLGMTDTGFRSDPAARSQMPDAHPEDVLWWGFTEGFRRADEIVAAGGEAAAELMPSGGAGIVSTIADCARFARMLASGGSAGGIQLVNRALFDEMVGDQLGRGLEGPVALTGAGYGFGLAGAVRLPSGSPAMAAPAGEFSWSGITGQSLFVAPGKNWFAVMLSNNMASRVGVRFEFRRAAARLAS